MGQEVPDLRWLLKRLGRQGADGEVGDALVIECVRFLWANIHQALDVPTIVRRVPATRRTMERRFRSQLGFTIRQVVAFARIELAKWLLAESSLPIHRVAERAGFSSSDWMGKAFRQYTGMTPSEYRRSVQWQFVRRFQGNNRL